MLMLGMYALLAALSSTFAFGKNLQFSHFVVGLDTLAFYGFFSMTVFGAIYFFVPRITGAECPSGDQIRSQRQLEFSPQRLRPDIAALI